MPTFLHKTKYLPKYQSKYLRESERMDGRVGRRWVGGSVDAGKAGNVQQTQIRSPMRPAQLDELVPFDTWTTSTEDRDACA